MGWLVITVILLFLVVRSAYRSAQIRDALEFLDYTLEQVNLNFDSFFNDIESGIIDKSNFAMWHRSLFDCNIHAIKKATARLDKAMGK